MRLSGDVPGPQRTLPQPLEPTTERLHLRQWLARDRAPFAALNADPAVMRYFPSVLSREDSDRLPRRA